MMSEADETVARCQPRNCNTVQMATSPISSRPMLINKKGKLAVLSVVILFYHKAERRNLI